MVEVWYGIIAVMLTLYVVMDGFDLGAGALHLLVAHTNDERRQVLSAIGPYWDANEVWLIAAGGALFVAFPAVLASGLSGFYFALFLVLWCLILRGVAIEFRGHVQNDLWRAFWDRGFSAGSILLAIFFGVALGNLLRGVPLGSSGWFALTLFTDFSARAPQGILDWYTILVALFALIVLMGHGAAFLAWKADGVVHERSRRLTWRLYLLVGVLWPVLTVITSIMQPAMWHAFLSRPLAWLLGTAALAGFAAVFVCTRRQHALSAFAGSSAFLGALMLATATCLFPVMLRSADNASLSLTAYNSSTDAHGLRIALAWWVIGFPLAVLYFVVIFRLHRGKATTAGEGEGY
ncbi:MAG TPA: cytochrome d ubiquinol oxidase subunit II [Gemmatimonadaceae bacterium]|jgi:cytochrome d ubiquinol oxidase subunit II